MNSSIRQDRERRTDSITKEVVDKERLLPEEVSKLTSIYCTNKGRDQETGIPRQKEGSALSPVLNKVRQDELLLRRIHENNHMRNRLMKSSLARRFSTWNELIKQYGRIV